MKTYQCFQMGFYIFAINCKSCWKVWHIKNPSDRSCYVGPSCPVPGHRGPVTTANEGMFLLRGITDRKIQKLIVAMFNKQRLSQQWSRCVPLFSWDPALASAAQAWADQCALVEYPGNSHGETFFKFLFHSNLSNIKIKIFAIYEFEYQYIFLL